MVRFWIYPDTERLVESLRWVYLLNYLSYVRMKISILSLSKTNTSLRRLRVCVCVYMHIYVCICLENDRTLEAEAFLGG